jgi:choline dehydrogenase-like flavoprotein
MFYNFSEIAENDSILNADICIVGAGAAGITMALQYINTPYRILLLEGGAISYDDKYQRLYQGKTTKNDKEDSKYLISSRLRMFGGTTGHWNGFCRPFDDLDFEVRDWVPNSGWPISAPDLIPYYDAAAKLLQIKPFNLADDRTAIANRFLDDDTFTVKDYHVSPPTRFNEVYRKDLESASNIAVVLDASVVNINLEDNGEQVSSLDVASIYKTNKRVKFKARQFVLATGGIENAKVLLNSTDLQQKGIGNQNGIVGKYFLEHAEYNKPWNMTLALPNNDPAPFMFSPTPASRKTAAIMPTVQTQRQHKILNASGMLQTYKPESVNKNFTGISNAINYIDSLKASRSSPAPYQPYSIFLRTEMTPNENNHCYLVEEKDVFGNQQVALKYKVDELIDHTISAFAKILGVELGYKGIGRVNSYYTSGIHLTKMRNGWHHMGTTRMASSDQKGVVDSNCKVFGINNLYIAGSSVFATSSYANPTFTIVALALRLTKHIQSKLTS